MTRKPHQNDLSKRGFILLALGLIAFYVIIPQFGSFRDTLPLLQGSQLRDVWLALGCAALTYIAGAGTYYCLAIHRLKYSRTVLVQVAGMFVNRLLPAGIGSIGVNYAYLRKARHSRPAAASVVALNNALGIFGHALLLITLLVVHHQALPPLQWEQTPARPAILLVILFVIVLWLVLYKLYGRRLLRTLREFGAQLVSYRQRPTRLIGALACSMGLTLANVLALWFCVAAMDGGLSFMAVFLVFTFGIALGTATPTPGGLGGIEVGLAAGLIAYQVDEATALAIVLLYRLLTYWLPLLAGSLAFLYAQKRNYL